MRFEIVFDDNNTHTLITKHETYDQAIQYATRLGDDYEAKFVTLYVTNDTGTRRILVGKYTGEAYYATRS